MKWGDCSDERIRGRIRRCPRGYRCLPSNGTGFNPQNLLQSYGKESRYRMVWRQVINGSERPACGDAPPVSVQPAPNRIGLSQKPKSFRCYKDEWRAIPFPHKRNQSAASKLIGWPLRLGMHHGFSGGPLYPPDHRVNDGSKRLRCSSKP